MAFSRSANLGSGTGYSVKTKGGKELQEKLGKLAALQLLKPAMDDATLGLVRDLKQYPTQSSTTGYRRTNLLKRGWTAQTTIGKRHIEGIVGNNVKYAPYVQDTKEQSAIHRRNWKQHTIQYIAKKRSRHIADQFNGEISRIWRSK